MHHLETAVDIQLTLYLLYSFNSILPATILALVYSLKRKVLVPTSLAGALELTYLLSLLLLLALLFTHYFFLLPITAIITPATTTTIVAVSDSSIILFISARARITSPIVYAMCITPSHIDHALHLITAVRLLQRSNRIVQVRHMLSLGFLLFPCCISRYNHRVLKYFQ